MPVRTLGGDLRAGMRRNSPSWRVARAAIRNSGDIAHLARPPAAPAADVVRLRRHIRSRPGWVRRIQMSSAPGFGPPTSGPTAYPGHGTSRLSGLTGSSRAASAPWEMSGTDRGARFHRPATAAARPTRGRRCAAPREWGLLPRAAPSRRSRLVLVAEPPLPLRRVDSGLEVVAPTRHVVDARAVLADDALGVAPSAPLFRIAHVRSI